MHAYRLVADEARQVDDVRNDQLSDRSRVGERRVEDRNCETLGRLQIDLIRANAEAASDEQVFRAREHVGRQLRHAANANDVHVFQRRLERVALERALHVRHVVTCIAQRLRAHEAHTRTHEPKRKKNTSRIGSNFESNKRVAIDKKNLDGVFVNVLQQQDLHDGR